MGKPTSPSTASSLRSSAARTTERPPLLPVAIAAVAAALFALPLAGLIWRAPWSEAGSILSSEEAIDPLRLSFITSLSATAVPLVLGVPLAPDDALVD